MTGLLIEIGVSLAGLFLLVYAGRRVGSQAETGPGEGSAGPVSLPPVEDYPWATEILSQKIAQKFDGR